jgi:uncharacterized protein YggE
MNETQMHGWKYWLGLAVVVFIVVSMAQKGGSSNNDAVKTITVQGTGDAYAIQDTVELSFTVTKVAGDVKTAQNNMNTDVSNILKAVKDLGVQDKDIKTTAYNVYPNYTQVGGPCPANTFCPMQSKQDGFEASQTVDIKMHDLSKSGDLVTAIGKFNPTNVSGLQFVVEDDQAVMREARQNAIADAKTKAQELSKDLGVNLGKIVSFDESGGNVPGPIMYARSDSMAMGAPSVPANIPTGQNKVTSNVTIVYEIR